MPNYVSYSADVEQVAPDEQETFDALNALFTRLSDLMLDRMRHGLRGVHAKSHGLLVGNLVVNDDLAPELRQGLFATPGKAFPVAMRFSTNPGDILADSVSTPRGLGVKVMDAGGDAAGEFVDDAAREAACQDFVLSVGDHFAAKDAKQFLGMQKLIVLNANDPEAFKKLVSGGARAVNAVLGVVGLESPAIAALGYPSTHPLGESYFSQAAIRYGDHIAKISLRPKSENLKALANRSITSAFHYSAVKDAIVEFFDGELAQWELCVQLCTDLEKMPVEDPTVAWDQALSPFVCVATLDVPAQPAYGNARRVMFDDRLVFTPWHALAAHRPLGNIMRSRKGAYETSARNRMQANATCPFHPTAASEIPA